MSAEAALPEELAGRPEERMRNLLLPALLSLALSAVIAATFSHYGIAWDEPIHCSSAIAHAAWFRDPSLSTVDASWSPDHEHPPWATLPGAFSWYVFHRKLALLDYFTAFRLQNILWVWLLTFGAYSIANDRLGAGAGVAAALLSAFLPRLYADAHVVALDYPMSAAWVMTAWTFQRGLRNPAWMAAAAFCLGMGLLIKINGFFLYATMLTWFAISFRRELWQIAGRPSLEVLTRHRLAGWGLIWLLALPPAVFVIGWPWLWANPFARTLDYLLWHLGHFPLGVLYLGKMYLYAPWHYPFVLTAVTIPAAVLAPLAYGMLRFPFGRDRMWKLFLLVNALVPIMVVAFLTRCKYDGVRLWLPAFPFLCVIAAVGLRDLWEKPRSRRGRRIFVCLYAALTAATVGGALVRYHPYESAYYNELVGGAAGAEARGFESDYWGGAYQEALPWLKAHPEARVWAPINSDSLTMYRDIGVLDPSFRFAKREESDCLILYTRQGCFDDELWRYYRREKPVLSAGVAGVRLVAIYKVVRSPGSMSADNEGATK